jgi:hypothetical protein
MDATRDLQPTYRDTAAPAVAPQAGEAAASAVSWQFWPVLSLRPLLR